jgi:hypothetical protein
MASTTDAKTIIDKASLLLADVSQSFWLVSELLGWLNDGQRDIATVLPQANVKNSAVQLVAGVKQSLPSDGILLLDIPHNLGSAGTTVGAVINHVPKEIMLKRIPGWTTTMANGVVKHYVYTATDPLIFYVYPPQPLAPKYVECVYSALPALIANANAGTKITIPDYFQTELLDYVLYRAFSKDFDNSSQVARGQEHYQLFVSALTAKTNADTSASNPTKAPQA